MTGLTLPASMSSVRTTTSFFLKGFHHRNPIFLLPASKISGPRNRQPTIRLVEPPAMT